MNEQKTIRQLKLLKKVKARKSVIEDIYRDISFITKTKKPTDSQKIFYSDRYILITSIILLILAAVISQPLTYFFKKSEAITRITLSSNRLTKSSIALSYAISNSNGNAQELSDTIFIVDSQMSSLKLMGEPGKYTTDQCKDLYRTYDAYLNTLEYQIKNSKNKLTSKDKEKLLNQIDKYEKETDFKLNLYR